LYYARSEYSPTAYSRNEYSPIAKLRIRRRTVALVEAQSPPSAGDEGGEVTMLETVLVVPVDVEILVIEGDGNREVAMLMLASAGEVG